MNKRNLAIGIGLFLAAIIIIIASSYYWIHRTPHPTNSIASQQSSVSIVPPIATSANAYGLFLQPLDEGASPDEYLDDGVVSAGPYAGYHRIALASWRNSEMGGILTIILATKDYKTFILDSNTDQSAAFDVANLFDPAKVIAAAPIPLTMPATIEEGNFVLERNGLQLDPLATGTTALASNVAGLSFFNSPYQTNREPVASTDTAYASYAQAMNTYLGSYSDVLVQDESGLIADYALVPRESFGDGGSAFSSREFRAASDTYATYGGLFPGGCSAYGIAYVLDNIDKSDLIQIATSTAGTALYAPKDANHLLNKGMYYVKVTSIENDGSASEEGAAQYFASINNGALPPTYAEYVAKDPVIIFQDPWGRWVGEGEQVYDLPGGCGKPVIYLYPQKPTEVSLNFLAPMHLTTDIPTYGPSGWKVMASPGGQLKDLQPSLTDCAKINSKMAGSEYAQSACEENDYPYLYWAGTTEGKYPVPTGGWAVPQKDLSAFLDDKLGQLGLTAAEKADMTSYWIPELLAKKAPYYRMSFFQTDQMNRFIPMEVSPRPDTVIRVFLDWSPLSTMPAAQPQPQILHAVPRNGFTVVEWGGLKQ